MGEYDDVERESRHHFVKTEPKFCKCRVCHEYFYAETIAEAQLACQAHGDDQHPEWGETVCYCPE
jgi:hypothetical protein